MLTLDFPVPVSVQYTLNTLYLTQKHKNMLQKPIDPNCTKKKLSFHYFNNRFFHIKLDFNLKSSFLTLDFSHKGQSRDLAQTCKILQLYQ